MSHRTSADSSESLELLLDTICNTFGAVIFISMLVAILVSRSAPAPGNTPRQTDAITEAAAIQAEVRQARERLRALSRQLEQQKLVTSRFASSESLALARTMKQLSQDHLATVEQKSEAVAALTNTNAATAILQERMQQQRDALDAAEAENQRLRSEVDGLQELSGRTARIPQLRRTTKQSCVFAIDDGKLYRITTPDQAIDDVDCEITVVHANQQIRPRASAGMAVSVGAEMHLKRRFSQVRSQQHFVQLFVSRDSFGEFLPVKDSLVELGIEYELVVTEGDQIVLSLGSSTRESFVQ